MMDFRTPYNRENFLDFLRFEFLPSDYMPVEQETGYYGNKSAKIISITELGYSQSLNLHVLEIIHTSSNDARVTLTKEIFSFLRDNAYYNCLVVFVPRDSRNVYRLSFIKQTPKLVNNKLDWEHSNPKRFSYLLGVGQHVKTPQSYLGKRVTTIAELEQCFSVEALTKEFYTELYNWYLWASTAEINIHYPNNFCDPDDNRDFLSEHLIRLVTRLMFVWFIKQKGLVPGQLFETGILENEILSDFNPESYSQGNYYNAILQNLFFASLNKKISERKFASGPREYGIKTLFRDNDGNKNSNSWFKISHDQVLKLFETVPFLNGGLFECLDKPKECSDDEICENNNFQILYFDGFSRDDLPSKRAFIPNAVFFAPEHNVKLPQEPKCKSVSGIINIFKKYNFTVEENTPNDIDVALDPELLGKVFENLLAAYNPETGENARKSSGSFYTPREVVDYMVNESLEAYLEENVGNDWKDKPIETVKAIHACRIIDPACGSGAFPMGILNKMLEIIKECSDDINVYNTKLALIKDCIYGVDIQPIAVQISKLRFFISLICEQTPTSDLSDNYGIHALPNLETKFVAANTLIGLDGNSDLFNTPKIKNLKEELTNVRIEHFIASNTKQKSDCRQRDKELRDKLAKELRLTCGSVITDNSALNMASWNPYDQNMSSKFFDATWMFGTDLKDGFDIVIGNPPYGAKISIEEKQYYRNNYKSALSIAGIQKGSTNTYVIFIEKAYDLLKENGFADFIVPLSVTSSDDVSALHNILFNNCGMIKVASFSERPKQIFPNACQATSIIFFKKTHTKCDTLMTTKKNRWTEGITLENFIKNLEFFNSSSYKRLGRMPKIGKDIEGKILEKIFNLNSTIGSLVTPGGKPIYYRSAGGRYFKVVTNYPTNTSTEKSLIVNKNLSNVIGAIMSSSLFWWYVQVFSDDHGLKSQDVELFTIPVTNLTETLKEEISELYKMYLSDIERNSRVNSSGVKEYKIRQSRNLIDKIDDLIGPLYNLTAEEINFIKNYEGNFRLSDE